MNQNQRKRRSKSSVNRNNIFMKYQKKEIDWSKRKEKKEGKNQVEKKEQRP